MVGDELPQPARRRALARANQKARGAREDEAEVKIGVEVVERRAVSTAPKARKTGTSIVDLSALLAERIEQRRDPLHPVDTFARPCRCQGAGGRLQSAPVIPRWRTEGAIPRAGFTGRVGVGETMRDGTPNLHLP